MKVILLWFFTASIQGSGEPDHARAIIQDEGTQLLVLDEETQTLDNPNTQPTALLSGEQPIPLAYEHGLDPVIVTDSTTRVSPR